MGELTEKLSDQDLIKKARDAAVDWAEGLGTSNLGPLLVRLADALEAADAREGVEEKRLYTMLVNAHTRGFEHARDEALKIAYDWDVPENEAWGRGEVVGGLEAAKRIAEAIRDIKERP